MNWARKRKLMIRWSIVTAAPIALFWAIWYLCVGNVPEVLSLKMMPEWTISLPFGISRWWDILLGPIYSVILILLFTSEKIRLKLDYLLLAELSVGLSLGLVLGLGAGVDAGLVSVLVAGLLFGLSAVLLFELDAGLSAGLFFGLGAGLGAGMVFGVVAGLGVVLGVGMVVGLKYFSRKFWFVMGR